MQEKTLLKLKTRTSNIHSSEFCAISYDIFGSPYQKSGSFLVNDSLDFGYLGKPYNADTELYDYGFRDYSPEIARFTTVDPIRDGRNWYSYVVNDPVNYVDLWGLCGSDGNVKKISTNENFLSFSEKIDNTNISLEIVFSKIVVSKMDKIEKLDIACYVPDKPSDEPLILNSFNTATSITAKVSINEEIYSDTSLSNAFESNSISIIFPLQENEIQVSAEIYVVCPNMNGTEQTFKYEVVFQ